MEKLCHQLLKIQYKHSSQNGKSRRSLSLGSLKVIHGILAEEQKRTEVQILAGIPALKKNTF